MLRRTSSRSRDDVVAGHRAAPPVGAHERAEHGDRRRLAGAVGAEEAEGLAAARPRSRCRAPPRPRRSAWRGRSTETARWRPRRRCVAVTASARRSAVWRRRPHRPSSRSAARRRRGSGRGRGASAPAPLGLRDLGLAAVRMTCAKANATSRMSPPSSSAWSLTSPLICSHGAGRVVAALARLLAAGVGEPEACARRSPPSGSGPRPRAAAAPGRPSPGSGARRPRCAPRPPA